MPCAQLMSQFVPGDLVVAKSVVIARFSVYIMYMPNDGRWWSCGEALCNDSDISVTDRGKVSHSESAVIGLYDSSATGDCPAAATKVSLYCHCSWG